MKTWAKLTAIFVPLTALGAWMLVDASAREARMTEKTTGVLRQAELHEDDESSSLDETRVTYTFRVGADVVEGSDALPGDHTSKLIAGREVAICYNPADPSESDVELDPGASCGG